MDRVSVDFRVSRDGERERLGVVVTHHRRMKILSADGLAEARVSLPVDGFSRITSVVARSLSSEGRSTPLGVDRIRRRSALDIPGSESIGWVEFEVPGAEVGGLVEYYYKRVYTSPDVVPVWVFGGRLPVLHSEFSVSVAPGIQVDYRWGQGSTLVKKKPLLRSGQGERERLLFVEKDLPPLFSESGSPHLAWLSPWVSVGVTGAVLGNRKYRMETWGHVQDRIARWTQGLGDGGLSIVGGSVEDVYRQVRDGLKGVAGVGLGVLQPVTPEEAASGKALSSRDAAAVLVAQLRARGEDAYVALLTGNFGPPLMVGFPGLYPFVRAVAAVDVHKRLEEEATCDGAAVERSVLCSARESGYAFVDPLCATCRFGELPLRLTGGQALVLTGQTPEWVDVPLDPPERNFTVTLSDLKASLNGEVRGDVRIASGGEPARKTRALLQGASKEQEEPGTGVVAVDVATALVGGEAPLGLVDVRFAERRADEVLHAVGTLESQFTKLAYDRFELRARDLVGLAFPWKWRSLRRSPRVLEGPLWRQANVTLELPEGFVVDVPEPVELSNEFGEFRSVWRIEGNSLQYWRSFVIRRQVVMPAEWRRFQEFLDKVRRVEESAVGILRTAESG